MDLIGDALRQAFMPKHEYDNIREEDRAWIKLQRPFCIFIICIIFLAITVSTIISLNIMFPSDNSRRPFCKDLRLQPLPINASTDDFDALPGAFYLTDQETVDYYYMVLFVPTSVVFLVSAVYLIAGMTVAYSAPRRHGCLKVVENNYCASRRGTYSVCDRVEPTNLLGFRKLKLC